MSDTWMAEVIKQIVRHIAANDRRIRAHEEGWSHRLPWLLLGWLIAEKMMEIVT